MLKPAEKLFKAIFINMFKGLNENMAMINKQKYGYGNCKRKTKWKLQNEKNIN